MFKTLLLFAWLFIYSCTSGSDTKNTQPTVAVQWQYITFEFNDTVIQVTILSDTLKVITAKYGLQKFPFNKSQKDSLFKQANELVDFEKQPERFCTDYVGSLKVWIRYNSQLIKDVSFTSICDWRDLNSNTVQIDKLLKKVFEAK